MAPVRSYHETIAFYAELRKTVYESAAHEFASLGVTASEITRGMAAAADMWQHQPGGRPIPWSWISAFNVYHRSKAKRFDIALSVGNEVCAVSYGVPSQGKLILKLNLVGGAQHRNPIKGKSLAIILYAATVYAKLLGSKEIRICDPLNDRLVALYESNGYTSVVSDGRVAYLYKKLG